MRSKINQRVPRSDCKVTLVCRTCGYQARRTLDLESGSHGVRETSSEKGLCPRGHGLLKRKDGVPQERWALWSDAYKTLVERGQGKLK